MKLSIDNITLRPLKRSDAQNIAKYANEKEVVKFLASLPFPYTLNDAKWFINKAHRQDRAGTNIHFAITLDKKLIGVISSRGLKDKVGEFGYWLAKPFWGQGIMSGVTKVFVDYLFSEHKMHKLSARVYAPNIASYRILEKIGFEKEGYLKEHILSFGTWHDIHYLSLLKCDWEKRKN